MRVALNYILRDACGWNRKGSVTSGLILLEILKKWRHRCVTHLKLSTRRCGLSFDPCFLFGVSLYTTLSSCVFRNSSAPLTSRASCDCDVTCVARTGATDDCDFSELALVLWPLRKEKRKENIEYINSSRRIKKLNKHLIFHWSSLTFEWRVVGLHLTRESVFKKNWQNKIKPAKLNKWPRRQPVFLFHTSLPQKCLFRSSLAGKLEEKCS